MKEAAGNEERTKDMIALAGVLVVASVLRFWALETGLPHLETRPDETQVLDHLALAAQGRFNYDWAVYPHAFVYLHWIWAEGIVRIQHLLGVSAFADPLTIWKVAPDRAYALGRALSALLGIATVAIVFVLGRRASDRVGAVIASGLVATCLLHVRESHTLKPDIAMTLFVTLAIAGAARLAREPTRVSGVIAGLGVGLAATAKYNGVLAAVPVAVGAWWGSREQGLRRVFSQPLLIAGVVSVVFFVAASPFLLINPAAQEFWGSVLRLVAPDWIVAPLREDPIAPEGPGMPAWTLPFGSLAVLAYHLLFSMRYGIGWVPTLLAPVALIWGLRSGDWLLRLSAVFLIVWLFFLSSLPLFLTRYVTPAVPALAILIGAFAAEALRRVVPERRSLAALCAGLVIVLPTAWSSFQFDRLAARTDTRVEAQRWLAEHTQPGSRIAIHGTRFWNWGAPRLPSRRRPVFMPGELDPRRANYLVTHDHELYWSTVDPEWLERAMDRLELVADFDPRAGATGTPVFEVSDAFYIPIAGFSGVSAPGPHVRIYRVR